MNAFAQPASVDVWRDLSVCLLTRWKLSPHIFSNSKRVLLRLVILGPAFGPHKQAP